MRDSNFYNIVQNNKKEFEDKNITVLYEGFEPIELWYLMIHFKELKINQIQLIEPMYEATIYSITTIKTVPATFYEFADIVAYERNETEDLYPDELCNVIKQSDLFIKFHTTQNPIIYLENNVGHIKAIYNRDKISEWDYCFPKPEKIQLQNSCIKFKKGNLDTELHFDNEEVMLKVSEFGTNSEIEFEPFWSDIFLREIKALLERNVRGE